MHSKSAKHISQSLNNVEFSKFASEKFSDRLLKEVLLMICLNITKKKSLSKKFKKLKEKIVIEASCYNHLPKTSSQFKKPDTMINQLTRLSIPPNIHY